MEAADDGKLLNDVAMPFSCIAQKILFLSIWTAKQIVHLRMAIKPKWNTTQFQRQQKSNWNDTQISACNTYHIDMSIHHPTENLTVFCVATGG